MMSGLLGLQMLISDHFPELSAELQALLRKKGEEHLAEQVPVLELVDRCRCGDDFCSTIYTEPKPVRRYGEGHRGIDLDAETGMIILDVVGDRVVCIEILNRGEMRKALLRLLP